ncbi:MAG TPA: hypothetical protein VF815_18780 [Myxococcaceae bacterium]|jgi:hypothetical protein
MISRINTQRSLCGLLALAIFSTTLGCSGGGSSDSGSRRNYRILSHVKETQRLAADYRERSGRYTIAFPDQQARDVSYYLRNYVTRGEGGVVLGVSDTIGDSTYTIDDETSTVTIESAGGVEQFIVNPDESITSGGTWFPNGEVAAAYLDGTSTLGAISDESVAVVHDQVGTEIGGYDDSSRSTAAVFVVAATWVLTSELLCRREYRRVNYNYYQMSRYCQDWCRNRYCR